MQQCFSRLLEAETVNSNWLQQGGSGIFHVTGSSEAEKPPDISSGLSGILLPKVLSKLSAGLPHPLPDVKRLETDFSPARFSSWERARKASLKPFPHVATARAQCSVLAWVSLSEPPHRVGPGAGRIGCQRGQMQDSKFTPELRAGPPFPRYLREDTFPHWGGLLPARC